LLAATIIRESLRALNQKLKLRASQLINDDAWDFAEKL
jgi:hypothetical protein